MTPELVMVPPADATPDEWAAAVKLTFATARALPALQGIPSHWLETMRDAAMLAEAAPPAPAPMAGDPVDNSRELTGNDALRFARESGMEEASRAGLFYAGVGDLIRFARLVRAGWRPAAAPPAPAPMGDATTEQRVKWLQNNPGELRKFVTTAQQNADDYLKLNAAYAELRDAAPVAVQPAPVAWQWRRKGDPWTLEKTFNSEVFATTADSEVRALYVSPSPAPAPVVTGARIDEREDFENYLRGKFGQDAGWFLWRAGPDGCYVYMQSEWEAWQARAILAAQSGAGTQSTGEQS